MAYMYLICNCVNCGVQFSCAPNLVPSIRVKGVREPLCEGCAKKWISLHPEANFKIPDGAYEPEEC